MCVCDNIGFLDLADGQYAFVNTNPELLVNKIIANFNTKINLLNWFSS